MPSRSRLLSVAVSFLLKSTVCACPDDVLQRGKTIYAESCAACHGEHGEGNPDIFPQPLLGDRSTVELVEVITNTMPEGEPELCIGEDAEAVARWMQEAFYSPEAQARINPPKIALSRLTVSQHRNAVADLASAGPMTAQPGAERGLMAQYYKSRHFKREDLVTERRDPNVDFNFGEGTPDAEKFPNKDEFSIRWEGSLIIDETGWYDFILKTENGGRLFVNDTDAPLIDAWVRSGGNSEYRQRQYLLSGRLYPLRLDWLTVKEPTASVGLWWQPPHGVDQPIPQRNLTPESSVATLVIETPFPPDDRSSGYERGTYVSKEWDEATTNAAIEAAEKVSQMLPKLAELRNDGDKAAKLQEFARQFVAQAFRRQLTDEQMITSVTSRFEDAESPTEAVRHIVLLTLKSPRFLYREVTGSDDQFATASRLSFALMNSLPDQELLQTAEKGQLSDEQAVRNQAWRLVSSYRSRTRLLEFLRLWLNLEHLSDISKDSGAYPDFTPELAGDLRTSLELSLRDAVDSDEGGFRKLLTSEDVWLNQRLAMFYETELPNGSGSGGLGFRPVKFDSEHRAGVASHPFLLSGFAYANSSSPIHRGVFLSRGILGRALKPPPVAVAPLTADLNADLTTRERVILQTSPPACANCHEMINPLGFALEAFDAVGRFRTTEKGRPIDDSGQYRDRLGATQQFRGARELADFLVNSEETHRSFVRQLFHHMVQQPILAYGPETIQQLADSFRDSNFNMRHLMVEIAVRSAMHRKPNAESSSRSE